MTPPTWSWWGRPGPPLRVRHAAAVLRRGARLEEVVFSGSTPLDRALQSHQRGNPSMGRNDRLLLGTAAYGLARNRAVVRSGLPRAEIGGGDLLLLALLDALALQPAGIPELPGSPERWTGALAAVAETRRRCASVLDAASETPPAAAPPEVREALAQLFSVPDWWLDRGPWPTVAHALGELGRLKSPQHLCLRVQGRRRSRQDVLAALQALGIPGRPTRRSPWGIVVEGRHNVLATPLYREGVVEVQDEGSQLVACLCDPRPNERLLDLCAGAGGKALALASVLGGRGSIVAYDPDAARLEQTRRRARRAGLGNIRAVADRAQVEGLGPYDLVVVDAPCSSSGTLRRNPDVAWRWRPEEIDRLTALQADILDRGARLVAPGKTLVYVTCSLLDDENQAQVSRFVERNPEFSLHPPGERRAHGPLLELPGVERGAFRLAADLADYDGDAFFLARFRRAG